MPAARGLCLRLLLWLVGLVGIVCLSVAAQSPPENPGNTESAGYVGAEVSQGCHEDSYQSFAKSAHAETRRSKDAAISGCEGCHGPGAEHVAAGGTTLERCTRCHKINLG